MTTTSLKKDGAGAVGSNSPQPVAEANLLQDNLRELQRTSLPLIAVALVVIAAFAFFWVHPEVSQTHAWDRIGFATCFVALGAWLLRNRSPSGAWFLAGGMSLTLALTFWLTGMGAVLLLLALPCILVTSYLGAWQGVALGLAASLFVVLLALQGHIAAGLPPAALIAIWGTIGLVWAALRPLRTVSRESWYHFTTARQLLEESRNRQQELNQANEDLRNAYKELGRLNQVLLATQRAADEARQAKESFVANVSHELRTPLNMIIGFSSLIANAPLTYQRKLPPHLLADVAAIQRNAEHLSSLVDDVLDLSKADAGQMALALKPVQVAALLEDAVQPMRDLFASKGLWLRLEIADDLPEVLCDSTRIRQVVMNLLSNAGKIVERGGVTINAYAENSEVVILVEDTGPGIPVDEVDHLFEPFRQLETRPASAKPGTGLGLAISKKLIELHGGRMWVATPATGAAFFFSLPIPLPLPAAGGPGRWLRSEFEYRNRRRPELPAIRKRLLFVDGDSRFYTVAMHYLSEEYELALAASPEEALAGLQRASAQLIILREAQGQQSAAQAVLSGLAEHIPIITCAVPKPPNSAAQMGIDAYLIKPIGRDTLLAAIGRGGQPPRTILIVDDEPEVIQLFSRMVASAYPACAILRAGDGRRALELVYSRRPDLVLLDLGLPEMNGHEVLAALHQDVTLATSVRVIVTSAQDPASEPIASDRITLFRPNGFSGKEMIEVIGALAETVAPFQKSTDRAPQDKIPG